MAEELREEGNPAVSHVSEGLGVRRWLPARCMRPGRSEAAKLVGHWQLQRTSVPRSWIHGQEARL